MYYTEFSSAVGPRKVETDLLFPKEEISFLQQNCKKDAYFALLSARSDTAQKSSFAFPLRRWIGSSIISTLKQILGFLNQRFLCRHAGLCAFPVLVPCFLTLITTKPIGEKQDSGRGCKPLRSDLPRGRNPNSKPNCL